VLELYYQNPKFGFFLIRLVSGLVLEDRPGVASQRTPNEGPPRSLTEIQRADHHQGSLDDPIESRNPLLSRGFHSYRGAGFEHMTKLVMSPPAISASRSLITACPEGWPSGHALHNLMEPLTYAARE
jgi:hypothetical protein